MREDDTIVTEGNVSYYAAASTVVYVKTPLAEVKVCRILFSKDGSILVPFQYLKAKRGVLAHVTQLPPEQGPFTYDLGKEGVVVDYDVKFSHHRSGVAHFSKTGETDLLPRRVSFPLTEIGHVFQLHVYWMGGLEWVSEPKKKDLSLGFAFHDEHPIGVRLYAEWRRKDDIGANAIRPGVNVGPRSDAIRRSTGEVQRFAFLGQPAGFPYRDHLLMLSVAPVPAATGADVPTMIFFGGFDPHERTPQRASPKSSGFLAFLYPSNSNRASPPAKRLG